MVLSNDVVPGMGVPVAAPGLRSSGIAEGLRAHSFDVELVVPADVVRLAGAPSTTRGVTSVVELPELMDFIDHRAFDAVVFTNANLTPHLKPRADVAYVYDLFAPKLLEQLGSPGPKPNWDTDIERKERALALADLLWVNGRRKLGYALAWLMRPGVETQRQLLNKPSLFDGDPAQHIQLVEMPVPGTSNLTNDGAAPSAPNQPIRAGIAGYAQAWSALPDTHVSHQAIVSAGHELHALLPQHWGAGDRAAPNSSLPEGAVIHRGPLRFEEFCEWVSSMHVMVDVFPASAERRLAMITRSVVALSLGVPVVHGVDSEVADIITEFDAGWVELSNDEQRWDQIAQEIADPPTLARKRAGARKASATRFAPSAALAEAASALHRLR